MIKNRGTPVEISPGLKKSGQIVKKDNKINSMEYVEIEKTSNCGGIGL